MSKFAQKTLFIVRRRYVSQALSYVTVRYYKFMGMQIGRGTILSSLDISWPHQVSLGSNCLLEKGSSFKFAGIWKSGPSIVIKDNTFIGSGCEFNITKSIEIGHNCLIASGCRFIDHDHGTAVNELMRKQPCVESPIRIGADVWIGCNSVILKGVNIGDGAVVAAGAVVTRNIGPMEVWGGVPARLIGVRRV